MGEDLDPFGRPKDENPLAALGWDGDETASTVVPDPHTESTGVSVAGEATTARAQPPPQAEPPPRREREREPVAATTAEPWRAAQEPDARRATRSARRPRRAPGMWIVRTVITLGVLVAILGGVIGTVVDSGVERAEDFARDVQPPDVQVPAVPGSDERSPSGKTQATLPARGLSVTSLLRPASFGKAVTKLRTGGYGRLTNLRVAPDRIDASMLTKGGRLRQVQIVPGGAARVLATSPSGFAGAPTMTMKGIDRGAPNRLTRSAAERLGVPASRVDYLVLTDFAGTRQWNVYFKGGQIFSADAHGRITRRIS
jgi:hypothetical protein